MRPLLSRVAVPLLAGGLAALVLPWSSASAGQAPAFSGHNLSGWAAPVKIEFFEPTIPIPSDPQFEVELAYTRVEAETGLARGRGSWLWPGDPVGEGAKTFADQLHLPPEVGEQGYPVQVNSVWPAGPEEDRDEPFPGMVMRTAAQASGVGAAVGWSPDGQAQQPGQGGDDGEGGGGGGAPGLPGVPGVPTDALQDFGAAITGSADTSDAGARQAAEDEPEDGGAPGVPEPIAALVDFTVYTSTSSAVTGTDQVSTSARSSLTDVALLGGIITVEGLRTRTVTTSDGRQGTADGHSALGALAIDGNAFIVGPRGVEAQGEQHPVPGLSDDPGTALEQLGVTFRVPEPVLEASGDSARSQVEGLVMVVDTRQLKSQLSDVPLGQIVDQVPSETGELKSALQALVNFSPKIVVTLGNAATMTDTVEPIPPVDPGPAAPTDDGDAEGNGGGGGGDTGGPAGTDGSVAPGAPADEGGGESTGSLADAEPMGSGLPPLNSIPGALLVGGIVAATAAGTWLRKIGAVALGGGATCPHGLDSGLPDLRKA